ncbi:MAG: hypothetical protein ABSB74_05900 [Tepidisphaeraceae bacterium]
MDLSKLPKLSNTRETPQVAGAPETIESSSSERPAVAPPSIGLAEAWISIALGLLLLFVFPNTMRYLHSPAGFQQDNPVTDAQGNTIPYLKSIFFWTDLGVSVFAMALILEGVILAAARKVVPLAFAFCVTATAAVFNAVVIVHAYSVIGFPVVCGVGVAVLVYMAMTQWRLIRVLRQ